MTDSVKPSHATVAENYLALLRQQGVKSLYLNGGTDFAPLVEAYAKAGTSEDQFPIPVLAAHENVVAGMAHGAYLVTGDPQAIMVHVNVGTANAACAVINAARDNVPLIVTAGRSPILEEGALGARDTTVQWAQEMYDQAGLVREMVKWEYELRDGRQVADVLTRAFRVATSHPRGPVYLMLPREVLAEPADSAAFELPHVAPPTDPAPDRRAVERVVQHLADAEYPVFVTTASGADPSSVPALAEFCRRFGVGVVEAQPRYVNVPADHPFHLGYRTDDVLRQADVICFLECAVPWTPRRISPRTETVVIQVGPDPLFTGYPIRNHRSDLTVTSTTANFVAALTEALKSREVRPRTEWLTEQAAAVRDRVHRTAADEEAATGPITAAFISLALGEALGADPNMMLFNEYWGLVDLIRPQRPGSYFFLTAAGGLGWGLPAAIGAKHAAPDRTVVAAIGDGSYFFANPAACHHASEKHNAPVLTVVANNRRWGAVDWATGLMYPDGEAARTGEGRLSSLEPMPAIERYVEASGGYGERVTTRDELRPALQRALYAVREERRQALLNVVCGP